MELLKKIWVVTKKGWMKFAHTIGKVNSTILLSILYSIVIGIYSIISGFIKLLALPFKKQPTTYWIAREEKYDNESFKHPF